MDFNIVVLSIIGLLSIGVLYRVIAGPTIWDRLLGFNLFSSKILLTIVLLSVITDRVFLLDIAIVYSLLGFLSIIMLTRFIARKGDI